MNAALIMLVSNFIGHVGRSLFAGLENLQIRALWCYHGMALSDVKRRNDSTTEFFDFSKGVVLAAVILGHE